MIIIAQEGKSYEICDIEQSGKIIKVKSLEDRRKKFVAGVYCSRQRALEVLDEIEHFNHKRKYRMPEI